MKITIETKYLKAMLVCMPLHEVRYYLCGMCMIGRDGEIVAYSTDGHRMSKWLVTKEYSGKDFEVIFDRLTIKAVIDSKAKEVELDLDTMSFELPYGQASKLIDGKYPYAEKIMNRSALKNIDGECFIDTKYLMDVAKIANLITDKSHRARYKQLNSSPDSLILFVFYGVDNFIHAIMPIRDSWETTEATVSNMLKAEAQS